MADHKGHHRRHRNAQLAKIHIAKKDLGMDDDAYREMLISVAGVESAGKLSATGMARVLAHLEQCGWRPAGKTNKHGRKPHNLGTGRNSRSAQLKKIEALLTVGNRQWKYADVLAKKICRVDSIAFVHESELYKIITALRLQAKREGWDLSGETQ